LASAALVAARTLEHRPLEAEALYLDGMLQSKSGELRSAEQSFIEAASTALAGRQMRIAVQSWIELIHLVAAEPDRHARVDEWNRYIEAGLQVLGPNPDLQTVRLLHLCNAAFAAGHYDKAQSYCEQALTLAHGPPRLDLPREAAALMKLGEIFQVQARFGEAAKTKMKALALWRQIYGEEHPEVAIALESVGRLLLEKGDVDEAIRYDEQSLAMRKRTLGSDHPQIAASLNNLGMAHYWLGSYEKAQSAFEAALALEKKTVGEAHPDYGRTLDNLALTLGVQGHGAESLRLHQQALELGEARLGPDHAETAVSHLNVALAFDRLGKQKTGAAGIADHHQALEHYQKAVTIFEKALGPAHPKVAVALDGVGESLLFLRQPEAACVPLERALSIYRIHPEDPTLTADTLFTLARALWESHRDRRRSLALAAEAAGLLQRQTEKEAIILAKEVTSWIAHHPL
jgi:tetratricopeptide (TPR) repeat protein